MNKTHYTYLLTNLSPKSKKKYYIGFRSCYGNPENDPYYGSSSDKQFLEEIISNTNNVEKIIIAVWPTRKEAHAHETQLIREHRADISELFYNNPYTRENKIPTKDRPLCSVCRVKPAAINYVKNDIVYYRSKCNECNGIKKRHKPFVPRWKQKGYKQKTTCDRCGFRAKYPSQIVVFHVNGNLDDATITNLRSICLNCVVEIDKDDSPWKQGDLMRDF